MTRRLRRRTAAAVAVLVLAGVVTLAAQTAPAPPQITGLGPPNAERARTPATLTYFNRPILELRATVLGRDPVERAAGATLVLDDLVAARQVDPIEVRTIEGGVLISVAGRFVFGVSTFDVDELAGETPASVAGAAAARLNTALAEAVEATRARAVLRAAAFSAGAIAVGALLIFGLGRARRAATARLAAASAATMAKAGLGGHEVLRASRLLEFQRSILTSLMLALQLAVVYVVVGFVLRQFPYTRPWGDSLRGYLLSTLGTLGLGVVHAIPGLFAVLIIVVVTRVVIRVTGAWFNAVERGAIAIPWMYPEAARPTRRLVAILLWLFAIVVAYPFLPGSNTDAFKGVSVFIGVIISLGTSGLVNQVMSGFVVTYSRALRVGNYVRIGEIEGTVTQLGVLSTKVRTLMSEEVTIPHAVVVSQVSRDYSRLAETGGVLTPISVTIGYDAPWRQVHALLLQAAERTPGLRREPKPHVLQSSLEDFYVRYVLYVSLDRQDERLVTVDALNRNIQDCFNEYGVQIMSPNYMLDPASRKLVPKSDWFAAPAKPEP